MLLYDSVLCIFCVCSEISKWTIFLASYPKKNKIHANSNILDAFTHFVIGPKTVYLFNNPYIEITWSVTTWQTGDNLRTLCVLVLSIKMSKGLDINLSFERISKLSSGFVASSLIHIYSRGENDCDSFVMWLISISNRVQLKSSLELMVQTKIQLKMKKKETYTKRFVNEWKETGID